MSYILQMTSKKRKTPSTPRKILPERNVILHHSEVDEFTKELKCRNWHKDLTNFVDGTIDVAIVK